MGKLERYVQSPNRLDSYRYQAIKRICSGLYTTGSTALEVGPADGTFARLISDLGFTTTAVDMERNPQVRTEKRNAYEYVIVPGGIEKFDHTPFDLVHAGQMLEHVPDPYEVLSHIKQLVRGHMIMTVPNFQIKSGEHLTVFTKESAMDLFSSCFEVTHSEVVRDPRKHKEDYVLVGRPI